MKSPVPSRRTALDDETGGDDGALLRTLRFTYRHSVSLVVVSLAWSVLSLPVVTLGPTTLGLYCAIDSLRETGEVDRDSVYSTVRTNVVAAVLFGLVPLVFGSIGLLYLASPPLWLGSFSLALGTAALYVGLYLAVLLVPTFYGMARGNDPTEALRTGYVFVASDPITAVRLIIVTLGFLALSVLLTVALVLIFPAITAAYHVHLVDLKRAETDDG